MNIEAGIKYLHRAPQTPQLHNQRTPCIYILHALAAVCEMVWIFRDERAIPLANHSRRLNRYPPT